MSDNNKIFSVIIPVYNGERTIARVLASLISSRDYIHEVIVVDDHSEDKTLDLIDDFNSFFPMTVMSSDGYHNPSVARKTGLFIASGKWVTFVDADDCLTPSSLRYVKEQIDSYDESLVLLHTQTIYYESGSFVADNVGHADNSCGGNFYKRDFLIGYDLYPHDILRMAEDEYFNTKITRFIEYIATDTTIEHYDYPVYEVHHDIEDGKSYAMSNWVEYLIKYHLLCQIYLTQDLMVYDNEELNQRLKEDYLNAVLFGYMLLQALIVDQTEELDVDAQKRYFRKAVQFYCLKFDGSKDDFINHYNEDAERVQMYHEGAVGSSGVEFENSESYEDFIGGL